MSGLVGPALNFNKTYPERVAYIHTMDPQYTMLWRRNQSAAQQVAQQQLNQQGFAPTKNNRIDFGGEFPAPIALRATGAPGCQVDLDACTGCGKRSVLTPWSKIYGNKTGRFPCAENGRDVSCRVAAAVVDVNAANSKKVAPVTAQPTLVAKNLAANIVSAGGAVEQVLNGAVQSPTANASIAINKINTRTEAAKTEALAQYAASHGNNANVKGIYARSCRSCGL